MEAIEYYVVFFENYISVAPSTWIKNDNKIIRWPRVPISHKKMAVLQPGDTWFEYDIKKFLGPYGKSITFKNLYCHKFV